MKTTLNLRFPDKSVLLLVLMCCLSVPGIAQNLKTFHVVETTSPVRSVLVDMQSNNSDYHFTQPGKPGPYIISQMIMDRQVDELHLYLNSRPGALLFSSGEVNASNIVLYESFFAEWKNHVKSRVVIHSEDTFTGTEGSNIKALLEKFTGLEFIMAAD